MGTTSNLPDLVRKLELLVRAGGDAASIISGVFDAARIPVLDINAKTTGTLPATRGGTGVTTASAERDRLGLGYTTASLPVVNGGTGANNAGDARGNLGLYNGYTYDTGWATIAVASGFSASSGLAARRVGHQLYYRGQITGTIGAAVTTIIGTAPSGVRPPTSEPVPIASGSGFVGWGAVNPTNGQIQVHFKSPYAGGSLGVGVAGLGVLTAD